jgi:hypothetical protein
MSDSDLTALNFAIADASNANKWLLCHAIEGIYSSDGIDPGRVTIRLDRCSIVDDSLQLCTSEEVGSRNLGDADLEVLDSSGDILDSIYLENVVITHCRASEQDSDLFDITAIATIDDIVGGELRSIWQAWSHGRPQQRNLWIRYSSAGRRDWLRVARSHHPMLEGALYPQGLTYEIEGAHISNAPGFYCALGEAINGPGGYFGTGPDSLSDCLLGDFGARTPFTLVWRDPEPARASMGSLPGGEDHFEVILEILAGRGVTVVLE